MTTLQVPQAIATSPQDSGPLRFETDTQLFSDGHGNSWTLNMLRRLAPAAAYPSVGTG